MFFVEKLLSAVGTNTKMVRFTLMLLWWVTSNNKTNTIMTTAIDSVLMKFGTLCVGHIFVTILYDCITVIKTTCLIEVSCTIGVQCCFLPLIVNHTHTRTKVQPFIFYRAFLNKSRSFPLKNRITQP